MVPTSVAEGAGATPVTVTGTLEAAAREDHDTDVTVSVGAGKVQPVDDFTFTIPAGSTSGSGQITVTPVDDATDGPDGTVTLTGTATVPQGTIGLSVKRTALTIADDDTRGLVIAPATLALTEGGAGASYTLRLATQPTADVTVTPAAPGTDLEFAPAELTFTPSTWDDRARGHGRRLRHRSGGAGVRAEVGDFDPGQDQEPRVVDHQGEVLLAQLRRPPDELVARGELPRGGAEAEHGDGPAVAVVDGVAHLGADQGLVSEIVVAGDELVPELPFPGPRGRAPAHTASASRAAWAGMSRYLLKL